MSDNHSHTQEKVIPFEEFAAQFEQLDNAQEKLEAAIDYMRCSLNNKKPPYFKGFWEARKLCFPLFKEQLEGTARAQLWNLYTELTREGRELKNMLDQDTTFAVEQIDLAISSLEKELEDTKEGRQPVHLPAKLKALEADKEFYCERQAELNLLNLFATRVNGLRKELAKTEMRVRHKNKFFQRLSKLGDCIFPRRKELIREISEKFEADVTAFVDAHFSEANFCPEQVRRAVFFYREEIKMLQSCAKLLTINTHAFSSTRESLSRCWDMLRGMEKELKKEFAHQKEKSSENAAEVKERLEALKGRASTPSEACRELDDILQAMRQMELTRQDVIHLKEEIQQQRQQFDALVQEKRDQEREKRKEKLDSFKEKLLSLQEADLETLDKEVEECRLQLGDFSRSERLECEKMVRQLKDRAASLREEAILSLPDDARASLHALEAFLEEKKQERREIKERIEELRRQMGGSSLDFEKGMEFGEWMEQEKERLAKCDHAIGEVDEKIALLKRS